MPFQIGDRVRCVGPFAPCPGLCGTVMYVRSPGDHIQDYAISFDEPFPGEHHCYLAFKEGIPHGYWCLPKCLEFENVEPELDIEIDLEDIL